MLGIALLLSAMVASVVLAAEDPVGVSFTLEGCKGSDLPDGYDLEANNFICTDGAYTTGNLGKSWNELDLVPHRVTTSAGNSAPNTQTYRIAVVADHYEVSYLGYDVLSEPILNVAKSDASCSVVVGDETVLDPGVGGTDQSLYRYLDITQNKNTTCVLDYYERLAVGSHLYPGSSLHSNLLNQNLGTGGIGNKDVSIPVNEIEPQELNKDMTATQDADHIWNITKAPTPANLTFNNTCLPDPSAREQDVAITIEWDRLPASPSGDITVVTNIYATNPAARSVTINLTDVIRSGTTELDTENSGDVVIPANTTQLVLTHSVNVPDGTIDLNDIASASYIDTVTEVPVPGQTTATASAPVQPSGTTLNQTAVVNDVESISGSYLGYSADSFTPADIGAFDFGYIPGTITNLGVSWTSVSQSGAGFVTFNKTVYVDQPAITSGALSDVATLTGSDGFSKQAALDVGISTNALVNLTINKTIIGELVGEQQATFTFDVTGPGGYSSSPNITFFAGETGKSVTLQGLAPGAYTVEEVSWPDGWAPVEGQELVQTVNIDLPACSGSASFINIELGSLTIDKVVEWSGVDPYDDFSFEICISGPSYPLGNEAGACHTFGPGDSYTWTDLYPGDYTVSETDAGVLWSTSVSGGEPAAVPAGGSASATVTNTYQPGSLTVDKTVVWSGVTPYGDFSFEICISGPSFPSGDCQILRDGESYTWSPLIPGSYTVSETDAGVLWSTEVSGSPAAVPAGGSASATVTNTYQPGSLTVDKAVVWSGAVPVEGETFEICISGPSYPTGAEEDACYTFTYPNDLSYTWSPLIPGSYTVFETDAGVLWSTEVTGSPATVPAGGSASATVTNTFNPGEVEVLKTTNGDPNPNQIWTFQLYAGPDGFCGQDSAPEGCEPLASDTTEGKTDGKLHFGNYKLDPRNTYTLCELGVNGGWSTFWQIDWNGDGVGDVTVYPYNPNADDVSQEDSGNRCVDIGTGTSYEIAVGGTLHFIVDNSYPGGAPRTPGYWKNWNMCTRGNQQYTATRNAGYNGDPSDPEAYQARASAGFFLIEDVITPISGDGITWDDILVDGLLFPITTCEDARNILDKRDLDGKKKASDPLHNLATHLLAAQLNFGAGACMTPEVNQWALEAETLLDKYDFDGYGHDNLNKKHPDARLANELAGYLDRYNNGEFCGDGEE